MGRPLATGPSSLTTLFATNNSFAGNTFDITTNVAILINGFDVNIDGAGPTTMAVYWRPGTSDGFESAAAGWTLLGTDVVTPAGTNSPTHVDVGGLNLDAGQTYGFYIDVQSYPSSSMLYTNAGGPVDFSNADFTITTFYGKGNPAFTGETFVFRQWNGTVHYAALNGVPAAPPVVLLVMFALLGLVAVVTLRRRARVTTA
jgi:hypothetical protein